MYAYLGEMEKKYLTQENTNHIIDYLKYLMMANV